LRQLRDRDRNERTGVGELGLAHKHDPHRERDPKLGVPASRSHRRDGAAAAGESRTVKDNALIYVFIPLFVRDV
jgi:hypothetical protein